jgi:hypothetical protein
MSNKLYLIIALLTINVITAQNKNELLKHFSNDKSMVIEKLNLPGEIYKITDKISGRSTYKNLGEYKPKNSLQKTYSNIDTTVIYPDLVDTTQFEGMYEYWISVPVGTFGPGVIVVGDVNVNGNSELYGSRYNSYLHINERSMYEFNPVINDFEFKTDMPWDSLGDYGTFKQIYDINMNGKENVFITGNEPGSDTLSGIRVARTLGLNDSTNLPTDIVFDYKQWYQMKDPLWGEYDNKEGTDLFYCGDGPDLIVAAARYDKNANSAETVFVYHVPEDIFYLAGLSNQDIDGDGFADLVTGGLRGDIVIFEYQEDIQNYKDVWYGDAGTFNVYIHFNTNDIDGNGKKEIWVGGEAFYDGVPITRLSCLEANGNNEFETKHVIDIMGRFSFDAFNGFAIDINKDRTEEIGLCLGNTFLALKFTGNKNQWGFDLFYLKLNNIEQTETKYFGAKMYDVNSDNNEELLLITSEYFNNYQNKELFTYIYKPTDLVGITEPKLDVKSYKLHQNYPNPFNPTTEVKYEIGEANFISLKVYNILGEEVATLINKEQKAGSYNVVFKGNNLPSGIYLIKMTAHKYSNTIKALLIK